MSGGSRQVSAWGAGWHGLDSRRLGKTRTEVACRLPESEIGDTVRSLMYCCLGRWDSPMTTTTCLDPDPEVPGPAEPAPSSPPNEKRRPPVVVVSLATTVLIAAGTAGYLYFRSRADHPTPGSLPAGSAVLDLDLGSGSGQGVVTIAAPSPSAGLPEVRFSFLVPPSAGAVYEVEVRGPAEDVLMRVERGPLLLDDLGGARVGVPGSRFTEGGDHRLVLRQFASDGGVREFRYPFRVNLPRSR
jgi:hypothetical protein